MYWFLILFVSVFLWLPDGSVSSIVVKNAMISRHSIVSNDVTCPLCFFGVFFIIFINFKVL